MKHTTRRFSCGLLAAAAAAAALVAASAVPAAAEGSLTRDEVRAELADARANGLLDRAGEAGATDDVLAAREQYNAVEALVIAARRAIEQHLADNQAADLPTLVSYVEESADGPMLVLLMFDDDGSLYGTDTLSIAAID